MQVISKMNVIYASDLAVVGENDPQTLLSSPLTWGGTGTVWSCTSLWPPFSKAVAQRLYIIKGSGCKVKHRLKEQTAETQSEAESSCSNTMIACLSLPVVRALHQPTTIMTACHT